MYFHINVTTFLKLFRVDSTWESFGCHESERDGTTLIRCTCESDLCNAPIEDQTQFEALLTSRGHDDHAAFNFLILSSFLFYSLV